MKEVSDHLLTEILLRLPDAQSAIQTSVVCKRWHSVVTNEYFEDRFNEIHPKVSDILINCTRIDDEKPRIFHLLSLGLTRDVVVTECDLPLSNVVIRATCADLILVSKGLLQYFVCSCLTYQSLALPKISLASNAIPFMNPDLCPRNLGFAIVYSKEQGRFKVIIIFGTRICSDKQYVLWMQSFDTQTKEWNFDIVSCPFSRSCPEVTITDKLRLHIVQNQKGVLYWLDNMDGQLSLIEFDSFSHECRVVGLPPRFNRINTNQQGFNDIYRLGVVCDRVRMSQLVKSHDSYEYELFIWELDASYSSWALIHKVSLEAPDSSLYLLAMDPVDGDIIFLIQDAHIFRFNITINNYHIVSRFPRNPEELNEDDVARFLTVLDVNHPAWPLPISLLQS